MSSGVDIQPCLGLWKVNPTVLTYYSKLFGLYLILLMLYWKSGRYEYNMGHNMFHSICLHFHYIEFCSPTYLFFHFQSSKNIKKLPRKPYSKQKNTALSRPVQNHDFQVDIKSYAYPLAAERNWPSRDFTYHYLLSFVYILLWLILMLWFHMLDMILSRKHNCLRTRTFGSKELSCL